MKSLFVALLAVAATAAENTWICFPRSVFKVNRDVCVCTDDGKISGCRETIYPKDAYVLPRQVCEPGKKFNYYCNTCECADDGMSFICTKLECDKEIWNQDGTMNIELQSPRVTRSAFKQICEPGTQFNDYCNICGCADDGLAYICTRRDCDRDIWNKDGTPKVASESTRVARSAPKQVCKPRSQFKNYCNTCGCADDGLSFICTRMECAEEIWNEDGTLKIAPKSHKVVRSVTKQACEPGSRFNDYCNTCGCANDGLSFICTRRECDTEIWNKDGTLKIATKSQIVARSVPKQVCQPRSQFKNYCNTCKCADDGFSFICTRMECDESIWNEDGTLKINSNFQKMITLDKVCEAGKAFSPDGCNTCVCDEDGTHFACTLKLCLTILKQAYEIKNTKKWGLLYKQGDSCIPGKAFYSECNKCVCTDGGKNAFCTLMACS